MRDVRSLIGSPSSSALRLALLAGVSVLGMATAEQASAGVVTVGAKTDADVGTGGTNSIAFVGGTLTMNGNATAATGSTISSNSTVSFGASNAILTLPSLAQSPSGTVRSLISTGTGTVSITGAANPGGFIQNGSTNLVVASGGSIAGSAVSLAGSGSSLNISGAGSQSITGLNTNANTNVALGSNTLTITGSKGVNGTVGPRTITGTITNTSGSAGGLAFNTTGQGGSASVYNLFSNNNSTLVGSGSSPTITLASGVSLNLNSSGSIGKASVQVASGATLAMGGSSGLSQQVGGVSGAGSLSLTNNSGANYTINSTGQSFSGVVSGGGPNTTLTIGPNTIGASTVPGTQTVTGTMTYTGQTVIQSAATLAVSNLGVIASSMNAAANSLTINTGGTLAIAGGTNTMSTAVAGSGTVSLSAGSLTVSGAAATNSLTFMSASGSSLNFTSGTIGGLVNNGTTTAGIAGATNTPLNVTGNFTNGSTGILSLALAAHNPTGPMLNVAGTAYLGGELYLNYGSLSGTPTIGDFYPLIYSALGYQGDFSSFYASSDGNPAGSCSSIPTTNPSYKDVWQCGSLYFAELINNGTLGIGVIDPNTIPEPASMALLGMGLLGLGLAGRRRLSA